MRRSLADPLSLDGEAVSNWTPPAQLPARSDVEATVAMLQRCSVPASRDEIKVCLKYVSYATAHKEGTAADWTFRARVYLDALRNIPLDIWVESSRELALSSEWWPPVARFAKHMHPKVDQRRRMLDRARRILEVHNANQRAIAAPKAATSDPDERITELMVIHAKNDTPARVEQLEQELARRQNREPRPLADVLAALAPKVEELRAIAAARRPKAAIAESMGA